MTIQRWFEKNLVSNSFDEGREFFDVWTKMKDQRINEINAGLIMADEVKGRQ
jgi:hypothetical protein